MKLRFILSQTVKGLRGNLAMAFSVTLVTFVSLLFIGAAILLQTQIGNLKNDWYDKVEVSAFMCPQHSQRAQCAAGEASQEQIDDIAKFLETKEMKPYIAEVYFESKDDALKAFKKQMADSAWADAMTADQMQPSYRVKLVNPQEYKVVADALEGRAGVESVVDQRKQLEPLFNTLNNFTLVSGGLAVVMVITAMLLIPSTIRLSAMFRRNETEILRYVGASNKMIQLPFILEGIIASLVGAVLAILSLWTVVEFLIKDWFGSTWVQIVGTKDVLILSPILLVAAIVIASFASFFALRRYTRV
ncbi:cell division transport system permease protein [Arcanobacterium pluranimalium]|uniref:permease-like cell division protein FtsX n=1 Tax=Arcanobacterium pluranimalium TaxID=108028 RepID=UPI00195B650A|nr:permease-like cell division protein FtsX [Arcanobacterium pluranimalium]MBM7825095.1 cell division transport system permease protein [Arcanobacterium pluranimalium]